TMIVATTTNRMPSAGNGRVGETGMADVLKRHGVIVLDKPAGITSRACVDHIQRRLNRIKAGHAGTLDPFATGVLPICLGRATKLVDRVRTGAKTYEAELQLGVTSDTLDCTGTLTEPVPVPDTLDLAIIRSATLRFVGIQEQTPPMYSACKIAGIRLYFLARKQIAVPRKPRQITIHSLDIDEYVPPVVRFRVTCSEGTYVRVLAADLAQSLGTVGLLSALRRTRVGAYDIEDTVTLDQFDDAQNDPEQWILPTDTLTRDLLSAVIDPVAESRFRNGAPLETEHFRVFPDSLVPGSEINLYSPDHRFLGIAIVSAMMENGKCTLKTVTIIDI
ncbi:tRNA pseudouridine(55) synthase TruB, partial [bacterium]|nr:tRNA pseudouridine(55) synthase TruB [candidate division CSSED10-310 bacterium]